MKKLLILILCVFVGVMSYYLILSKRNTGTADYTSYELDRATGIVSVSYDELIEKMNSETTFILYIGRPDCSDCQTFYPYLESFITETRMGIYYLNIQDFRDAAKQPDATKEEVKFYENLQENLNFDWVPTLQKYHGKASGGKYTFLSLEYYEIEDEAERQKSFDDYIYEMKVWLLKNW